MGCDGTLHVYQSLVITNELEGLSMAVLGVNWDDTTNQDLTLDLVSVGIATDTFNTCEITDLYTGLTYLIDGKPQVFKDIKPHSHFAKKIKCLPW
jgi:hypothetical protein